MDTALRRRARGAAARRTPDIVRVARGEPGRQDFYCWVPLLYSIFIYRTIIHTKRRKKTTTSQKFLACSADQVTNFCTDLLKKAPSQGLVPPSPPSYFAIPEVRPRRTVCVVQQCHTAICSPCNHTLASLPPGGGVHVLLLFEITRESLLFKNEQSPGHPQKRPVCDARSCTHRWYTYRATAADTTTQRYTTRICTGDQSFPAHQRARYTRTHVYSHQENEIETGASPTS